jgi:hypothetical protein
MSASRRDALPRRLQVVLGLALMGLVLVPATSGAVAAQDSVTASGSLSFCGGGQFQINAQSGPNGENPTGQVTGCGTVLSGPVTCLNVQDNNVALLTAQATSVFGPVVFKVVDNDPSGTDHIYAMTGIGTDCAVDPGNFDLGFTGSLEVFDAPPLPTSKDQCKNGGWRNYPQFKNQGDCVSFVENGK